MGKLKDTNHERCNRARTLAAGNTVSSQKFTNYRKRERARGEELVPLMHAHAMADLVRRSRMTKKQRKAEDFLLGLRPPRPWYHPDYGTFHRVKGGPAFPGFHPKWDETARRKLGLRLAAGLGAQLYLRPHQRRSFLGRLKGALKSAFRDAMTTSKKTTEPKD